jgi:acetyl-CoA acetyltransferase
VPGQTVNRLCGSGLQAVNRRPRRRAGEGDVFVAGGVESMSRAPYVMLKPEEGYARGAPSRRHRARLALREPALPDHYTVSLGETAERVAERYGVDAGSAGRVRAGEPARAARRSGRPLRAEIVPVRSWEGRATQ